MAGERVSMLRGLAPDKQTEYLSKLGAEERRSILATLSLDEVAIALGQKLPGYAGNSQSISSIFLERHRTHHQSTSRPPTYNVASEQWVKPEDEQAQPKQYEYQWKTPMKGVSEVDREICLRWMAAFETVTGSEGFETATSLAKATMLFAESYSDATTKESQGLKLEQAQLALCQEAFEEAKHMITGIRKEEVEKWKEALVNKAEMRSLFVTDGGKLLILKLIERQIVHMNHHNITYEASQHNILPVPTCNSDHLTLI